jgi:hypothetical protein
MPAKAHQYEQFARYTATVMFVFPRSPIPCHEFASACLRKISIFLKNLHRRVTQAVQASQPPGAHRRLFGRTQPMSCTFFIRSRSSLFFFFFVLCKRGLIAQST